LVTWSVMLLREFHLFVTVLLAMEEILISKWSFFIYLYHSTLPCTDWIKHHIDSCFFLYSRMTLHCTTMYKPFGRWLCSKLLLCWSEQFECLKFIFWLCNISTLNFICWCSTAPTLSYRAVETRLLFLMQILRYTW
jgi:hypothetical protein